MSYDEPQRSDEEDLADLERLIAQDPASRPEPTATEIIARCAAITTTGLVDDQSRRTRLPEPA